MPEPLYGFLDVCDRQHAAATAFGRRNRSSREQPNKRVLTVSRVKGKDDDVVHNVRRPRSQGQLCEAPDRKLCHTPSQARPCTAPMSARRMSHAGPAEDHVQRREHEGAGSSHPKGRHRKSAKRGWARGPGRARAGGQAIRRPQAPPVRVSNSHTVPSEWNDLADCVPARSWATEDHRHGVLPG